MPSVIGAAHKHLVFDRRTHVLASRLTDILFGGQGGVIDRLPR
jgi:hypothetical protein